MKGQHTDRKRSWLWVVLTLFALSAGAQDYIIVRQTDGTETKYYTDGIECILFGEEKSDTHAYVDLGLPSGTMWATCNIGAESPEGYGSYVAWGETEPHADGSYGWSSYRWCKGNSATLTRYCTDSNLGTVDNKRVLDPADDVATASWGDGWRMPTDAQITELQQQCTWTWTTLNGTCGQLVTSTANGNTIFLPAAGARVNEDIYDAGSGGYYYTCSLNPDSPESAYALSFLSTGVYHSWINRCCGMCVRAVRR